MPDTLKTDTVVEAIQDSIIEDSTAWRRIMDFEAEERLLAYGVENKETKFVIKTKFGDIKVRLYESTPLHRASMVLMIKNKIFDNSRFYRVTKNFIVQAGFTDGPGAYERISAIGRYKIPSEVNHDKYPHVRGAFAMAGEDLYPGKERSKKSNPFTFYIVDGEKQTDQSLEAIGETYGVEYADKNKSKYKNTFSKSSTKKKEEVDRRFCF